MVDPRTVVNCGACGYTPTTEPSSHATKLDRTDLTGMQGDGVEGTERMGERAPIGIQPSEGLISVVGLHVGLFRMGLHPGLVLQLDGTETPSAEVNREPEGRSRRRVDGEAVSSPAIWSELYLILTHRQRIAPIIRHAAIAPASGTDACSVPNIVTNGFGN